MPCARLPILGITVEVSEDFTYCKIESSNMVQYIIMQDEDRQNISTLNIINLQFSKITSHIIIIIIIIIIT